MMDSENRLSLWREWRTRSLKAILRDWVRAWWQSLETADPWPAELDAAVRDPDAVPICHRCFTPCADPVWFCPACGAATGPYNNILPYVRIFSMGEVLRSGVSRRARYTPLTVVGYVLVSLQEMLPLAPFYLGRLVWRMIDRVVGRGAEAGRRDDRNDDQDEDFAGVARPKKTLAGAGEAG